MSELAGEVTSYRHGRVPRSVRERQIQGIAADLFAERGYAGTSMEEIARRAGLSRPVVYDLAGSKAALFERVLAHSLDELVAEVGAAAVDSSDVWTALRAGLVAFFRFADARPAEFELAVTGSGDPELSQSLQALRARSNRHIADLFADMARQAGVAIDERRLDALAHAVQGAGDYFALWRSSQAPDLSADEAAAWMAELLEPGLRLQLMGPVARS